MEMAFVLGMVVVLVMAMVVNMFFNIEFILIPLSHCSNSCFLKRFIYIDYSLDLPPSRFSRYRNAVSAKGEILQAGEKLTQSIAQVSRLARPLNTPGLKLLCLLLRGRLFLFFVRPC